MNGKTFDLYSVRTGFETCPRVCDKMPLFCDFPHGLQTNNRPALKYSPIVPSEGLTNWLNVRLRFSLQRGYLCSSCGLWCRVDLQVNTNVSKDHIVSIFRAEDGSSTSFRNFGIYLQLHKTSQLGTTQKTYYYAVIDWLTDYVGRDRSFRTAAIIGL
jgi:hypothetical protein